MQLKFHVCTGGDGKSGDGEVRCAVKRKERSKEGEWVEGEKKGRRKTRERTRKGKIRRILLVRRGKKEVEEER